MQRPLEQFLSVQPTPANQWRAIILFGRNSASYKFALANALLDLGVRKNELITLEELALPFANHVCRHLTLSSRQGTNSSSKFLDACGQHLKGNLNEHSLIETTVRLGFANVVDAFHNLGSAETNTRFFVDDRKTHKGIRVTEDFQSLVSDASKIELGREVEARWRLVETAWSLGLNVPLIEHETAEERLIARTAQGRVDVTSCRDALNGYQKGHCFYCSRPISVVPGDSALAHVDHFIPFALSGHLHVNLNGVWNLVLACQDCNLGKSDAIPSKPLVFRLAHRNEFLISSHHPLRETLIAQTGLDARTRESFIGRWWADAYQLRCAMWSPADGVAAFL